MEDQPLPKRKIKEWIQAQKSKKRRINQTKKDRDGTRRKEQLQEDTVKEGIV